MTTTLSPITVSGHRNRRRITAPNGKSLVTTRSTRYVACVWYTFRDVDGSLHPEIRMIGGSGSLATIRKRAEKELRFGSTGSTFIVDMFTGEVVK